jgi:DNA polymerase III subunit epsilon
VYAIVDIETTGGIAGRHRITEIAVVLHNGTEVTGTYQTLVNPEQDIPPFILN